MVVNYYPADVVIPVYAVFTAVGITLTGLRFWARKHYTHAPPGTDDWLILFAMCIVIICASIQFFNALYGTGGEALSDGEAAARAHISHKINLTMIIIEKPAFGAIKLSLLFFYKRIFGIWPAFRRINLTLIWLICIWTLAFALADLLLCGTELELNWALDQSIPQKKCGDKGLLLLLFGVTSVITDILVLGLPFLFMRKLQMPSGKKWAAAAVFVLGFIATFAGLLRTIFLCIAYPMGRLRWDYEQPADGKTPLVLQIFNPTFWVMIEMCLGLWAANLPPLGPLLRTMHIGSTFGSVYRKFSYGSNSSGHSTEPKTATWQSSSTERIRSRDEHLAPGLPLEHLDTSSSGNLSKDWPV